MTAIVLDEKEWKENIPTHTSPFTKARVNVTGSGRPLMLPDI
jgi:hypothetical protein